MKQKMINFVLCYLSSFYILNFNVYNNRVDNKENLDYSKIKYSQSKSDIETSFVDSIIVVLDSSISGINIDHRKTIFKNFDSNNVHELTKIDSETKVNINTYKQIYQIDLVGDECYNYSQIEQELLNVNGVYYVQPNSTLVVEKDSNDSFYQAGNQWGLNGENGINAPSAWDKTIGSYNVRVGVIDSGIFEHVDLKANLLGGYDFYNSSSITFDDVTGHGTHVAGIIGAVGNNNLGISGVNWNVNLVPLQVHKSSNLFSTNSIIEAINYACSLWGTDRQIDILNFSGSNYGTSDGVSIREAIKQFKGLFVWSAGNDYLNIDKEINKCGSYNLDNLLSVGALTENGERSHFSNFSKNGTNVDIYAPGSNICSTVPDDGYEYYSGTSVAAPFVTGVAALLLSIDKTLTANKLKKIILENSTPIDIKILRNSDDLDNPTLLTTAKKLDASKAVDAILINETHTHNYNVSYKNVDEKQHRAYCGCGASQLMGHAVSSNWSGSGSTKCLLCGSMVTRGYTQPGASTISLYEYDDYVIQYFGISSYLSSNGFYYISEYDIEDVLNGMLELPINN